MLHEFKTLYKFKRGPKKNKNKLAKFYTTITNSGAMCYCLFALNKIIFSVFVVYACFGMLLKGMVESGLLSKDEPLTPNIYGVAHF